MYTRIPVLMYGIRDLFGKDGKIIDYKFEKDIEEWQTRKIC